MISVLSQAGLPLERDPSDTVLKSMTDEQRKRSGAYFTPSEVARALVSWAVRHPSDQMLDPSCGDGRFLQFHELSVGVEQDLSSGAEARRRAPCALVHEGDFFTWASKTKERFDCAVGNPPFIRYQRFAGEVRQTALALCRALGVEFSALTSSWAPFLAAAASLLKPAGRIAFVVPAEIGHAPYARPLLEFLAANFAEVTIVAVRQKIFRELSEDVWLLFADGFGGSTHDFRLVTEDRFRFSRHPPENGELVSLGDWRRWNYRLRSFLAPLPARELYREVIEGGARILGEVAKVGIGYVTGDNDFFHLRPSQAKALNIPQRFLHPSVRNGKALTAPAVTEKTVQEWRRRDDPFLLLKLRDSDSGLPDAVASYLRSPKAERARESYKCRNRTPWYAVPDVSVPDAFLTYMSSEGPELARNQAGCVCTNSIHAVKLRGEMTIERLLDIWREPFTKLSCELEGHPLGGGMLKLEPREAQRVALAQRKKWSRQEMTAILDGLTELRRWRHVGG